jgi:hypothetical protein
MEKKTPGPQRLNFFQLYCTAAVGVDRPIFSTLPKQDQRPYLRMGLYSLLITISLVIAIAFIYTSFFPNPSFWLSFCAGLTALGSFYLIRSSCKRMLNKLDAESKFYFILIDVLFSAVLGFGMFCFVCSGQRIKNEDNKKQVYAKLDSLRGQFLFFDSSIARKQISSRTYSTDSAYSFSTFSGVNTPVKTFAAVAGDNLTLLTTGYSLKLQESIDSLNQLSQRFDSIVYFEPYLRIKNSYFYTNTYYSPVRKFMAFVLTSFAMSDFTNLLASEKIEKLTSFSTAWAYLWCIGGILWMLILFALVISILNSNPNDFYHQLLAEREKALAESLTSERKRIVEDLRIQSELKNLQPVQQQATAPETDLDDYTPESLMIAASIHYGKQAWDKALEYVNKAIELDERAAVGKQGYLFRHDTYELKASILKEKKLFVDAELADKKAIEIKNENSFMGNKGKNIRLDQLTLQSVSIFDDFTWMFTPGINILLGKNGYGKSHLFGLIVTLLYDDKRKVRDWIKGTSAGSKASMNLSGEVPGSPIANQIANAAALLKEKQTRLDAQVVELKRQSKAPNTDEIRERFKAEIDETQAINADIIRLQKELAGYYPTILADNTTINSRTGKVPLLAIPDTRYLARANESIKSLSPGKADLSRNGAVEFLTGEYFGPIIENVFFGIALQYYKGNRKFEGLGRQLFPVLGRTNASGPEPFQILFYRSRRQNGFLHHQSAARGFERHPPHSAIVTGHLFDPEHLLSDPQFPLFYLWRYPQAAGEAGHSRHR